MAELEKEPDVVEQKEVIFYDDELTAVRVDNGQIYVSVDQMCKALGLTTAPQTRRIKRNDVLADGYVQLPVYPTKLTKTVSQRRRTGLLRVDLVALWLTGISTNAVREDVKDKLKRFQKEAAKVLWEAFQEGRLTTDAPFNELLAQLDNEAVQAYKIAQAVMKLAQNQILMEARLIGRLDEHEQRLEALESQSQDTSQSVSEDEASQISQAVKAVAITLGKQTKRNEFGAVYGEMYRKFGITSYKLLPRSKFQDAMDWLTEWFQSLHDDQVGLPF